MGAVQEFPTEGGGVAGCLGNYLSCGTSGGAVFGGGDVGAIGVNGVKVRGRSYGFPVTDNRVKGKAAEGQVVSEGGNKQSTLFRGDTTAPDLLSKETGNSDGVGGPTSYF